MRYVEKYSIATDGSGRNILNTYKTGAYFPAGTEEDHEETPAEPGLWLQLSSPILGL
jgi:hypothetical protein